MRGAPVLYSAEEMAWLEANRAMVISDYHRAFCAAFGRGDISAAHLHGLRKRKGWKVGREPGRYKGRRFLFSADEIAWLRQNCTLEIGDYQRAFCQQFGRDKITAAQLHALRKREGWKTGRTGHFEKGHVSHNKGQKMPFNANSAATRFKKGQLPQNFRGAGHERLDSKDGYVIMIVAETNPWTGAKTRPVHKHRWLWEKANGGLPDGHVLKCLDGDKTNCEPSNWQAVPREILPHLNGRFGMAFDQAEPEVKPVIMSIAKLKHAARNAQKTARSACPEQVGAKR